MKKNELLWIAILSFATSVIAIYAILMDSSSGLSPKNLGVGVVLFWGLLVFVGGLGLLSTIVGLLRRKWQYLVPVGLSIVALGSIVRLFI